MCWSVTIKSFHFTITKAISVSTLSDVYHFFTVLVLWVDSIPTRSGDSLNSSLMCQHCNCSWHDSWPWARTLGWNTCVLSPHWWSDTHSCWAAPLVVTSCDWPMPVSVWVPQSSHRRGQLRSASGPVSVRPRPLDIDWSGGSAGSASAQSSSR